MASFGNDTDHRSLGQAVVQSTFFALIMVSALVGNALVLFALGHFRVLRSKTTVFIANLAMADLGVSLTDMPMMLSSSIANRWVAGDVFCTINGITNMIFCVASMLTLAGIALDRYFAIVHPFRYLELMSSRRMAVLLAWIWLQPIALAILPIATSWSRYMYFYNMHTCTIDWAYSASVSCIIFSLGFFAPLTIMCFCYFHILKVALVQSRKIGDMESLGAAEFVLVTRRARQLKRDAKAAFMLLILIANFMACWSPFSMGALCLVFAGDECPFSDAVFIAAAWLAMANSGMNPLIYGLLDRRLRQAVGLILRCRFHERLDPTNSSV